MIVFPCSYNVLLVLFKVKTDVDAIGNKAWRLVGSKEVGGIINSISSKEYYASLQSKVRFDFKVVLQSFVYDGSKYAYIPSAGIIYRIERTYLNGQYIELYLIETDLKWEEIIKNDN